MSRSQKVSIAVTVAAIIVFAVILVLAPPEKSRTILSGIAISVVSLFVQIRNVLRTDTSSSVAKR